MREEHQFIPLAPQLNNFGAQPQDFAPLASQHHVYSPHAQPVSAYKMFQDFHPDLQELEGATWDTAALLGAQNQIVQPTEAAKQKPAVRNRLHQQPKQTLGGGLDEKSSRSMRVGSSAQDPSVGSKPQAQRKYFDDFRNLRFKRDETPQSVVAATMVSGGDTVYSAAL